MELWKDIPGSNGEYQASTLGNIKRVADGKIIQHNNSGYVTVTIYKRNWIVHRLVALTFIPNPENKPQVNHINGIKNDNRVENLEWVTVKENVNHAIRTGLKRSYTKQMSDKAEYWLDRDYIPWYYEKHMTPEQKERMQARGLEFKHLQFS